MEENKDMGDGEPKNLAEQREALAAFDKLDCAIRLIEEAIKEQPILKELQMEPGRANSFL